MGINLFWFTQFHFPDVWYTVKNNNKSAVCLSAAVTSSIGCTSAILTMCWMNQLTGSIYCSFRTSNTLPVIESQSHVAQTSVAAAGMPMNWSLTLLSLTILVMSVDLCKLNAPHHCKVNIKIMLSCLKGGNSIFSSTDWTKEGSTNQQGKIKVTRTRIRAVTAWQVFLPCINIAVIWSHKWIAFLYSTVCSLSCIQHAFTFSFCFSITVYRSTTHTKWHTNYTCLTHF